MPKAGNQKTLGVIVTVVVGCYAVLAGLVGFLGRSSYTPRAIDKLFGLSESRDLGVAGVEATSTASDDPRMMFYKVLLDGDLWTSLGFDAPPGENIHTLKFNTATVSVKAVSPCRTVRQRYTGSAAYSLRDAATILKPLVIINGGFSASLSVPVAAGLLVVDNRVVGNLILGAVNYRPGVVEQGGKDGVTWSETTKPRRATKASLFHRTTLLFGQVDVPIPSAIAVFAPGARPPRRLPPSR